MPGKTWQTINQSWTSDATTGNNPRLASVTTVLEDQAQTQSQTVFKSYDPNGNPTDVVKYDFGAGAPGPQLEETITSYTVLGNHILDRPADVKIKDGAGNVVFHKTFNYDETAVKALSPAPTFHDETNYSASGTLQRGNLTSTIVYNPAGGPSGLYSKFTYDEAGNMITADVGSSTHQQRNFSSATQYAYPDSVGVGPAGNQLTTSFVYDWFGRVTSSTDVNGQQTSFIYDVVDRPYTTTTPDNVSTNYRYDDNSGSPSATVSNSATSLVSKSTMDGKGRVLTQQVFNNSALVSTKSMTYNVLGELTQSSNPYGPNETPAYTTYAYDPLGRAVSTTPPVLSGETSQNPYKADYSGATAIFTDPALKQRKQYSDALGRLVRVDEPGIQGGASASGSFTIAGTEQSVPSNSASNGATAGTATITITPAAACSSSIQDRCNTQVLTHPATSASGTVTISGAENSTTIDPCADQQPIRNRPSSCPRTVWDSGTVSMTVNGITNSTAYAASSTASGIASALAAAFGNNGTFTVTASGNVIFWRPFLYAGCIRLHFEWRNR